MLESKGGGGLLSARSASPLSEALYLFLQGNYVFRVILCIVDVILAALDYVARTIAVGEAFNLHMLMGFIAMLGGIQLFSRVGSVAGPLVFAVSVALLDSCRIEWTSLVVSSRDS